MEQHEQLKKLNSDLHFLLHHCMHLEPAEIVYDALLHLQNTPGADIKEALDYISFKVQNYEDMYLEQQFQEQAWREAQFEDNLPF